MGVSLPHLISLELLDSLSVEELPDSLQLELLELDVLAVELLVLERLEFIATTLAITRILHPEYHASINRNVRSVHGTVQLYDLY